MKIKDIFLCNTDCFISTPVTTNPYFGGASKDYDRLWVHRTSDVKEYRVNSCEQGSNMPLFWIDEPTEKE